MQFMAYGDTTQLAAFAIVGYLASCYYFFAEGLVSGLQPSVSHYLGAKQYKRISETVKLAFSVTVGSGIALVILFNIFQKSLSASLLQAMMHYLKQAKTVFVYT